MSLAPGHRLGVHEVLAPLGAGGMGEVYRAKDTRLGRDVALKLLPQRFVQDAERVARFRREAQILASLNHPNIAAIYGVEEADGAFALALELVEGEDLAKRLRRGPVAVDEALAIAKQIAEGLEAAHEKGIVHRDLKPDNVKLTPDGTVKVLDFGLAKAWDGDGAAVASAADLSQSPTLDRGTQAGIILGTAAYMAPEQARGKAVDKRADVWAFGVVLFEMLSGRRLFEGETVSDVLAAVLKTEPRWSLLPADTPPGVRALLRRCLERDPRQRLRDIGEARIALEPGAGPGSTRVQPEARVSSWRRALPWALVAALGAVAGALMWNAKGAATTPRDPIRLAVELTDDPSVQPTDDAMGTTAVLSPAGDRLAFVAEGNPRLVYVRRLDGLTAAPVAGTEGAFSPFFSPDGGSIAFFANGKLKTVALSGGGVTTLADVESPRGGAWLEDGTIVFAPRVDGALVRVPASGGTPAPATQLDAAAKERTHRWPEGLPGGRGLLYTAHSKTGQYAEASLVVEGPGGAPRKVLVKGGYHGRYVASGHVLYRHEQALFAIPFDLDRLEVAGPAVPIVEGVEGNDLNATAEFSLSRGGLLAYKPISTRAAVIDWLDRSGQRHPLRAQPADYRGLRLSPTGDRVALAIRDLEGEDIWVLDLSRDTLSRLTFSRETETGPVWTPDGRRITYASWYDDVDAMNLAWQRADGTGAPERLTTSPDRQLEGSWHPSGRFLAFTEVRPAASFDVMILPAAGNEKPGLHPRIPEVFVSTPLDDSQPEFSPDGRWLAYRSIESGTKEIYVRPFPGPGGKWQISSGSGVAPRWSRTKPELFYLSGQQIMAVAYSVADGSFRAGKPQPWGELPPGTRAFDVHPDGNRLALIHTVHDIGATASRRVLVFDFLDELRRRAPRAR